MGGKLMIPRLRDHSFHWFYNVFRFTVFLLFSALFDTGPRMLRSWEKLVFYWFYKGSLADPREPGWGELQPT